jgi:hypothetical protein
VRTALRWTGWILLVDVALLAAVFVGNWAAYAVGADVQALKWPTAFYGGLLIVLLIPISIAWVALRWIAFFTRRKAH